MPGENVVRRQQTLTGRGLVAEAVVMSKRHAPCHAVGGALVVELGEDLRAQRIHLAIADAGRGDDAIPADRLHGRAAGVIRRVGIRGGNARRVRVGASAGGVGRVARGIRRGRLAGRGGRASSGFRGARRILRPRIGRGSGRFGGVGLDISACSAIAAIVQDPKPGIGGTPHHGQR